MYYLTMLAIRLLAVGKYVAYISYTPQKNTKNYNNNNSAKLA